MLGFTAVKLIERTPELGSGPIKEIYENVVDLTNSSAYSHISLLKLPFTKYLLPKDLCYFILLFGQ